MGTTVRQALSLFLLTLAVGSGVASAQTSASYRVEEHALNMGGRPAAGSTAASASFVISLDSLGEPLTRAGLSSLSYSMDGGLLPALAPPGEAMNLLFVDRETLDWDAHPSANRYHLYRDALGTLSEVYAGACEQPDLPASTTVDNDVPVAGDAWFYLVTVENRLGEEGTRGAGSSGVRRVDSGACP